MTMGLSGKFHLGNFAVADESLELATSKPIKTMCSLRQGTQGIITSLEPHINGHLTIEGGVPLFKLIEKDNFFFPQRNTCKFS